MYKWLKHAIEREKKGMSSEENQMEIPRSLAAGSHLSPCPDNDVTLTLKLKLKLKRKLFCIPVPV